MKILVFIKQVPDMRVSVEYDEATGTIKDDWNVPVMDPECRTAIECGVAVRDRIPGSQVTVVHLGPPSADALLRAGLAMGCDEALRVWDEGFGGLHSQGKAVVLSRVATVLGYDLILAGAKSADTASAQLGLLLGAALSIPGITRVSEFSENWGAIRAVKRLDEGFTQQVEASLPLVITMEASDAAPLYRGFPMVIETVEREIPCYDLSDIGVPWSEIAKAESLEYGVPRFPSARPIFLPAPDSSLPGFERRERLRAGTMQKREGRLVTGDEDAVVEEIFQALRRNGWLSHLARE
jgi:electron transfer flavoprotein beta subunit